MQPFLSPQGSFSTEVAWGNFTTSFFLTPSWPIPGFAFISLFCLIWIFTRQQTAAKQQFKFRIFNLIMLLLALILVYFWVNKNSTVLLIFSVLAIFLFFITLIYLSIKKGGDEELLLFFLIWTLVILVATLVQRRFAYYLVINIALLSAYISWQAIWWAGLRKLAATPPETAEKERLHFETSQKKDYYALLGVTRSASHKEIRTAFRKLAASYQAEPNPAPEAEEKFQQINKAYEVLSNPGRRAAYDGSKHETAERKKTRARTSQGITGYHVNTVLAIIVVFVLVFLFNITKSNQVASQARFAPSDAWQSSLLWMQANTPDPFGDPDAYYKLYEAPTGGRFSVSGIGLRCDVLVGLRLLDYTHRPPSAQCQSLPVSQPDNQGRHTLFIPGCIYGQRDNGPTAIFLHNYRL